MMLTYRPGPLAYTLTSVLVLTGGLAAYAYTGPNGPGWSFSEVNAEAPAPTDSAQAGTTAPSQQDSSGPRPLSSPAATPAGGTPASAPGAGPTSPGMSASASPTGADAASGASTGAPSSNDGSAGPSPSGLVYPGGASTGSQNQPGPTAWAPTATMPAPLGPNSQVAVPLPSSTPQGPAANVTPGQVISDSNVVLPSGMGVWKQPDGTYLVTSIAAGVTPTIRTQLATEASAALQSTDRTVVSNSLYAITQNLQAATNVGFAVVYPLNASTWTGWAANADGTVRATFQSQTDPSQANTIAMINAWVAANGGHPYEIVTLS